MTTFDEMCKAEEEARQAGIDLGKARDLVRQCSRRILDARNGIPAHEAHLEQLNQQIHVLKTEAKVVLLSEYEQLHFQRDQVLDLLATKRQEIQKLEDQARGAQETIPGLQQALQIAEGQLHAFGKVIQFRR